MSKLKIVLFVLAIALSSHVVSPEQVHAGDDAWALIDCYCEGENVFTSIGEPHKDKNELEEGKKITWLLVGPAGAKVSVEFIQQGSCPGTDPFETHPPFEETITNNGRKFDKIVSTKIATGMGGYGKCYGYKVTCSNHQSATQTAPGDPIIEVPR